MRWLNTLKWKKIIPLMFIIWTHFEYIVQYMNSTNKDKENHLYVLRKVEKNPQFTQRELAKELGFSLGKLNYCINELREKGLLKIKNFKKNPKKINYIYVLTPKGISEKTKLTINFMRKKMQEYDELQEELKLMKEKDKE